MTVVWCFSRHDDASRGARPAMSGESATARSVAQPPDCQGHQTRAAWEQVWHAEEDPRQASERGLAQVECRRGRVSETTTGALHVIKARAAKRATAVLSQITHSRCLLPATRWTLPDARAPAPEQRARWQPDMPQAAQVGAACCLVPWARLPVGPPTPVHALGARFLRSSRRAGCYRKCYE